MRSAAGAHFRLQIQNELAWTEIIDLVSEKSKIFLADNKLCIQDEGVMQKLRNPFTFKDRIKSNESLIDDPESVTNKDSIPMLPYYDVDFSQLQSISLIVGGETEGISDECYR